MSAREVAHRIRYRLLLSRERRLHPSGGLAPPERLRLALRADLVVSDWQEALLESRRAQATRFFAGVGSRGRTRSLFESAYRTEFRDTVEHAARARAHRFEFFGQQFQYPADIDWHIDPPTQKRWPARFHADVPVHGGDVGFGDVKYVWELSRQQYLIDLGKSVFLTGNREDAAALCSLVRSWIAANPYATGVNWSCALEPAFRAWSWLWAYHLAFDTLDDEFHLEWLESFYDHGRFLAHHLEHYSSPYNHLIGEASALQALGLCFPEFSESRDWVLRAEDVLEGRLGEQFYSDGGSVEQSFFYHHATTGFYLLAALMGRLHGRDLSQNIWAAIERGLEFSMSVVQPDGRIPAIGGADDGKPIRMEHLPFWDFRPYLAVGAVLFHRGDFKHVAGRFYEDALWLLGPDALDVFEGIRPSAPARTRIALAASGYFVDRTDWSPRADYVCFDIGEQAAGMRPDGVPNSMHGHADCLSVVVALGGEPVLVDSGLYAYNCGGDWEAHFRETAAHNTARVDGNDQARHLGKMAWSYSYRAKLEGRWEHPDQSWTIGSHDGYARGPNGVSHRRATWLRPGGYLLIYDEFAGSGEHDLELNFQFAPGALAESADAVLTYNDRVAMVWAASDHWSTTIACGGPAPADGWICPSLGVRVPAPRVTLRTRTAASRTAVVTALAARDTTIVRRRSDGSNTLLAIDGDGWVDWVAAHGISEQTPLATNGLLAVCRLDADGALIEARCAGGTFTRSDVTTLRSWSAAGPPVAGAVG